MAFINLGTYPPKQCGIATFSADCKKSLELNGDEVKIIAISDTKYKYAYNNEVIFNISQDYKQDYIQAAHLINSLSDADAVIIQHEYGIFGGDNGSYVLDFAQRLNLPYIVITHTVLSKPEKHQHDILKSLCSSAAAVVCMTEKSAGLLSGLYGIPSRAIRVIGHGVPEFKMENREFLKAKHNLTGKQVITTFGLIGPGKGLEIGIEAMAEVVHDFPSASYLILGQTHPMLRGENYREMLVKLTLKLGIEDQVRFVNKFLSDEELGEYLNMSDIYLSPYPNMEQAVSGTLTFAIGCGRAVIATPYAYALEVLNNGRGLLTDKADAGELARLIKSVLGDKNLQRSLEDKAYELGKTWTWPNIGRQYSNLLHSIAFTARRERIV